MHSSFPIPMHPQCYRWGLFLEVCLWSYWTSTAYVTDKENDAMQALESLALSPGLWRPHQAQQATVFLTDAQRTPEVEHQK